MNKPFDEISLLTIEAQVLERLRQAILQGYFAPGSQLHDDATVVVMDVEG